MPVVFLSYSTKDHFFAELAEIKLAESGIDLWRDRDQLRAGTDWRQGIESGISGCLAVVVALSADSAQSPYVTYEWAYALGKGKPIVPLLIAPCTMHPKLETIQHLTFTNPGALPWASLAERIREIETDTESPLAGDGVKDSEGDLAGEDVVVRGILAYLNQRGYQMASFERLRERVDENRTDAQFRQLVEQNPRVFRLATLRGGVPGLAKIVP